MGGVHRDVELALHAEFRTVFSELVIRTHLKIALFECETFVTFSEKTEVALNMQQSKGLYLKFAMATDRLGGLAAFRIIKCREIVIAEL